MGMVPIEISTGKHPCAECGRSCKAQYVLCFACYVQAERDAAYNEGYLDGMRDTREALQRTAVAGSPA